MKISCLASRFAKSTEDYVSFMDSHNFVKPKESDVIICLGGDGFMLHSIHKYHHLNKPFYGINYGSLGFLLNTKTTLSLKSILENSSPFPIHPLKATFTNSLGVTASCYAFNEVSMLRAEAVACHLQIKIDDIVQVEKLVGDGVLVSTPTGSTAYNRACGGQVILTKSNLLVLTPINPFHPLNWRGATLNNSHSIAIRNMDSEKRKLNIFCDFKEFINIEKLDIALCHDVVVNLLFDRNHDLDYKIMKSQFDNCV